VVARQRASARLREITDEERRETGRGHGGTEAGEVGDEVRVAAAGLPSLLVGDLSQPRGGPLPSDHASHQSGLDADVAFVRTAPAPLSAAARREFAFTPVVDLEHATTTDAWSSTIVSLLALAATDPAVDRIFVNPAVKREVCTATGGEAAWLAKLRPWWGHHDHFHVRLRCPETSAACRAQGSLPAGTGCGPELAWWFGPGPEEAARERRARPPSDAPVLPAACRPLVR
jgi:penicillin-insensitive murein DD-endopeptidase